MCNIGRPILKVLAAVVCLVPATSALGGMVVFTTPATAVQEVDLLGVSTTLTAFGSVTWNLDVDSNGNSVGSDSSIDAFFQGTLPGAFGPLAGAPFTLFSLSGPVAQAVSVTGNGTQVTVDTTFGLDVYGPGPTLLADFYTVAPSEFVTSVSGIPFTKFFAADPNRPNDLTSVYIGPNQFGLPEGTLVGVSFNRTVASVPEPSTLVMLSAVIGIFGVVAIRKTCLPLRLSAVSSVSSFDETVPR